ncbi:MAG TPA: HD domain-containing phosphohydrolase [Gemmatimonadaceae bacterium]|jgi:HD-GYP domain-containing protein (c-di-GMP phosphodiesterase class II)
MSARAFVPSRPVRQAMKPLLILAAGRTLSLAPLGRRDDELEVRRVDILPAASSLDGRRPTVIVLDRTLIERVGNDAMRLRDLAHRAAFVGIGDGGEIEPSEHFPVDLLTGYVAGDAPSGAVMMMLRGAFRHATALVAAQNAMADQEQRRRELNELTNVGVALSTQRDLDALLELILGQARRITTSDAGSLYLIERPEPGTSATVLRSRLTQNFTLPNLPVTDFAVPIDHTSLAGYAAATGEPLVIADVYLLSDDVSYKQNRSFDEKFGYRTKSMLVIPMKTHRDEIIGVLQLINRKRDAAVQLSSPDSIEHEVMKYDHRSVELVSALASQAAVAIENSRLYEDIERLFEGFVTAAVTAIEARDPTTSGHSSRVAALTVGLAEAVDRTGEGPYRDVRFTREQVRELRYAGLLHDFGKVGVREEVLVKQKKLYPHDLGVIRHRFAYLAQAADLAFERERADLLAQGGRDAYEAAKAGLLSRRDAEHLRLRRWMDAVVAANEPTVIAEGSFEQLPEIGRHRYLDFDGVERPLLEDGELQYLMIRRGNLDDAERREIESHVTHTFRFLQQIPWTRELRGIPEIAFGHHEKLNGTGYPRAVKAEAISVQTRMMTIADIFDALTANDRPYKRAVPLDRAIAILRDEARGGLLDEHLLQSFIDARVFAAVVGTHRAD